MRKGPGYPRVRVYVFPSLPSPLPLPSSLPPPLPPPLTPRDGMWNSCLAIISPASAGLILRGCKRPNHARHVGAGRALVCDQPILVLRGGTLVTSRSVFLHRGHAKLVRLLRASATTKPLRVNLSQRQRATPRVTYFRLGFSQLEPGSTEHAVR